MGRRVAVSSLQYKRIARDVSQQGIGAERSATTGLWWTPWTRCGTNVLLGRRSRQGARQYHRRALDPDGCLARFVAAM